MESHKCLFPELMHLSDLLGKLGVPHAWIQPGVSFCVVQWNRPVGSWERTFSAAPTGGSSGWGTLITMWNSKGPLETRSSLHQLLRDSWDMSWNITQPKVIFVSGIPDCREHVDIRDTAWFGRGKLLCQAKGCTGERCNAQGEGNALGSQGLVGPSGSQSAIQVLLAYLTFHFVVPSTKQILRTCSLASLTPTEKCHQKGALVPPSSS